MSAPYYLAVDVRAGAATAAVAEGGHLDAVRMDAAPLGGSGAMPTAVFVAADDLVFGDDALVRGRAAPERLIGDFVSLIPDPAAVIVVDGEEFSPPALYAWMIDAVVARVTRLRGAPPLATWAVVPAHWEDERVDAILDELDRDGHADVDVITVPDALTSRYAEVEPYDADLTLLVCDVDEREIAAAVVRATPEGRSRLMGAPIVAPLPAGASAGADGRALEAIVAGLAGAGVDADDLDAILLSGPSTDLPRVEQLLADRFGDPIGTDTEPAMATALGAVLALAQEQLALSAHATAPLAGATAALVATASGRTGADTHVVAAAGRGRRWYRRPVGMLALGAASLVLAVAAFGSVFVLDAVASSGDEQAGPSPSPTVATLPSGTPTSSAAPSATPSSPPAPAPAPAPPEADAAPPPTPSNPRIPNSASPRVAPAPAPVPPAAAPPPAAPAPPAPNVVPPAEPVPDPVSTPSPEPVETTEPEPVQTTEPTPDPTETGTPEPDVSETPAPIATEDPGVITP